MQIQLFLCNCLHLATLCDTPAAMAADGGGQRAVDRAAAVTLHKGLGIKA